MDYEFAKYIDVSNKQMISLLSSNEMKQAQKIECIEAFAEYLGHGLFSINAYEPVNSLCAKRLAPQIDASLDKLNQTKQFSQQHVEEGLYLIDLQKKMLEILPESDVVVQKLKYHNLQELRNVYLSKRDDAKIYEQLLTCDKAIDDCFEKTRNYGYIDANILAQIEAFRKLLIQCKDRQIDISEIKNKNLDELSNFLKKYPSKQDYDNRVIYSKMQQQDREMTILKTKLQRDELDDPEYVLTKIAEYERMLSDCLKRNIDTNSLENRNVDELRQLVSQSKARIAYKNQIYSEINALNLRIHSLNDEKQIYETTVDDLIQSLNRMKQLLEECKVKNLSTTGYPDIDIEEQLSKYNYYKEMYNIDHKICSLSNSLKENAGVVENLCKQQMNNIDQCHRYKLKVPVLECQNPNRIIKKIHEEELRKKRIRVIVGCVAATLVVGVCIAAFIIKNYYETHSRFPYLSNEYVGESIDTVVSRLKRAGFTNFDLVEIEDGLSRGGSVSSIKLNGENGEKKYYQDDIEISIEYYSKDRIDLTEILDGYNNEKFETINEAIKQAGITPLTLECDSNDEKLNHSIRDIRINGIQYIEGDCYVPRDSTITITYYEILVHVPRAASGYISRDLAATKRELSDAGFLNIREQRDPSVDYSMWNKVVSVSINGKSDFEKNHLFSRNAEIIITYR